MAKLNEIKDSVIEMDIQAGILYDRIVGPASQAQRFHLLMVKAVWNAGEQLLSTKFKSFYKDERLLKGPIDTLIYSLSTLVQYANTPGHDLLAKLCHRHARVLKKVLHEDEIPSSKSMRIGQILRVLPLIYGVLKKDKAALENEVQMADYNQRHRGCMVKNHRHMVLTMVQLISITCGILPDATPSQEEEFRKQVKDTLALKLRGALDQDLLQLASNEATSNHQYPDGDKTPVVKFPCRTTIAFLSLLSTE